jgi:hypothetical protein
VAEATLFYEDKDGFTRIHLPDAYVNNLDTWLETKSWFTQKAAGDGMALKIAAVVAEGAAYQLITWDQQRADSMDTPMEFRLCSSLVSRPSSSAPSFYMLSVCSVCST